MNILSLTEGQLLHAQSMQYLPDSYEAAQRLFRLAMMKFEQAIQATPDNIRILKAYASVLLQHATHTASHGEVFPLIEKYV